MNSFLSHAKSCLAVAAHNHQRVLITVAGDHHWTEQQATALLEQQNLTPLWVSDNPGNTTGTVDFNSCRRWLGREVDVLVFDAHAGFDPNVFALLCGTVKAGGALILLTPILSDWRRHTDPVNTRCSVWGQAVEQSRYLERLAKHIPSASQLLWQQNENPQHTVLTCMETGRPSFDKQAALVHAVANRFDALTPQLAVISGDRGRGKSAALGQLAAELARRGSRHILVSAPRKAAVEIMMLHASTHWPANAPPIEECLIFVSPDSLCLQPKICDCLIVDEMGGIHLGLLTKIITLYPRLTMAGTVHGYEGAGRGFHTRFRKHVNAHYPHCQWHQLQQPVRWASNDPLEHSCSKLLLLDADCQAEEVEKIEFEWLDRDSLISDELLLRQIYGLLATAHYRTRPLDLRQMLDGPNLKLAVLRGRDTVLAACLVAQEGPIDDKELAGNIKRGKRRPPGHLLPQLLLQRLQISAAAEYTYWRIVRIAVQSDLQNQGLGSKMLQHIERDGTLAGIDVIGSVFAADIPVFHYWKRTGFHPVLLGDNCEATSGSYALTVIKPLSHTAGSVYTEAISCWFEEKKQDLTESHPAMSANLRALIKQSQQSDTAHQ